MGGIFSFSSTSKGCLGIFYFLLLVSFVKRRSTSTETELVLHNREELARIYTAEIVSAVAHLHASGIMHRDLKPENILLDADGHVRIPDDNRHHYHTLQFADIPSFALHF